MSNLSNALQLNAIHSQLPVTAYFDEALLKREIDTLFKRGPRYIGHELMAPEAGSYFALPGEGEGRLLVRNRQDEIELLSNVCRHRQAIMLNGRGQTSYEPRPPRWTLAWKSKGRRIYEVNLMAFAQGGAWVIHGRMGLDRPFRNLKSVRERDEALLRQEILDQVVTDETVL